MMFRIPTSTRDEVASYTQRTTLDGREYVLTFDWNGRAGHWFFSIADQDEDPILQGVKVVLGWNLLDGVRDVRRPPGAIVAVDLTGSGEPPGRTELGGRVELVYYDAEELAS